MNATIDEIILLTGGVFLTTLGIARIAGHRKLRKTGVRVEGTVIENKYSGSSNDTGTYAPVIKYLTLQNEWVTKQYEIGSNPPAYREGETVKIIYNPDDKESFMLDTIHSNLLEPALIVLGIGLIIGVSIYYALYQYLPS